MKVSRNCRLIIRLLSPAIAWACCFGQTNRETDRLSKPDYLRHVVVTLSNPDFNDTFIKLHEASMINQLGLDANEITLIRMACQDLRDVWVRIQRESARITTGRGDLTTNDYAALISLSHELDTAISERIRTILVSVRTEVAARVRSLSIARDPHRLATPLKKASHDTVQVFQ